MDCLKPGINYFSTDGKQLTLINNKACLAEKVGMNKADMNGYAIVICNSNGNAKKAVCLDKDWNEKHGKVNGEYEVLTVWIPVEEGDYIISYFYNRFHDHIEINQIEKKYVYDAKTAYAECSKIWNENILECEKVDMKSAETYKKFGKLAKAVRTAYQKGHDFKYEIKPFCIMRF